MNSFLFQAAKETFCNGIIPAATFFTHTTNKAMRFNVSLRRDSVTWQVELFRMALTQSMTELSLDFVGSSKGGNAQDF
ncbi:hypothetical protein ND16A_2504, partial [Thalassotalea sp. ND16A]